MRYVLVPIDAGVVYCENCKLRNVVKCPFFSEKEDFLKKGTPAGDWFEHGKRMPGCIDNELNIECATCANATPMDTWCGDGFGGPDDISCECMKEWPKHYKPRTRVRDPEDDEDE